MDLAAIVVGKLMIKTMDKPYRYTTNTTSFAYFWNKGIGKALLQKIGGAPALTEADHFVPLLFSWDQIADQAVIDIYLKKGFEEGNRSLINHMNTSLYADDASREDWKKFFRSVRIHPAWLDMEKLRLGSEFCRRAGISALIVLRDYCLMGGYESAAINKPLVYTGALKKGPVKRLTDTVEFWVQVTKENGLKLGSEGLQQIFLTRMLHSYSRINILQHTDWDSHKWGIPINTWDMLATNLAFSLLFMKGLERIGIKANVQENEGIFHFWKYIGYLLGIPVELLPNNEEEAIHSFYLWSMTQPDADEDSRSLAKSLREEPILAQYPDNPLYRKMMREVHLFYNYYFLGDYTCKKLGLPKTTIGRFGIVNLWRAKKQQTKIVDEVSRQKAVREGELEQERVRQIYQTYNR